jgi:hypothetical protein
MENPITSFIGKCPQCGGYDSRIRTEVINYATTDSGGVATHSLADPHLQLQQVSELLVGNELEMTWKVGDACIATRRLILQQTECGPLIIEAGEQGMVMAILPDRSVMEVHWLRANLPGVVGKDDMSGVGRSK